MSFFFFETATQHTGHERRAASDLLFFVFVETVAVRVQGYDITILNACLWAYSMPGLFSCKPLSFL